MIDWMALLPLAPEEPGWYNVTRHGLRTRGDYEDVCYWDGQYWHNRIGRMKPGVVISTVMMVHSAYTPPEERE